MAKKQKKNVADPVVESAVSAVEQELLNVLELAPQGQDETDQKYFQRLVAAATELPDATWDTLTPAAQAWVNDGAVALNEKQPIAEFSDFAPEGAVEEPVAPAAPATAAPKAVDKPKTKSRGGATNEVRRMVIESPTIKVDEVLAALTQQGLSVSRSTVEVTLYETRATVRVLSELGMLR